MCFLLLIKKKEAKKLKRVFLSLISILFVVVVLCSGCATVPSGALTQVSTIDALLAGVYDGHLSLNELLKHGDFGIGTFNGLDGEMLLLDGKIYQVKADGKVYTPSLDTTTPFAAVTNFEKEKSFPLESGINFKNLKKLIDIEAANKNVFCGIKIKGKFAKMKTRSVPAQIKPYPPLVEVTKNQPVFNIEDVSGTIVGFRCPAYVKGINVPGYHLHFISDDLKQGGHILEFISENGEISLDIYNKFFLILPENNEAFQQTNLNIDRADELKKAEQ